jgi:transcriptional regulator with XRE-family HTH domain
MSELFVTRIRARKDALGLTMPQIAERSQIPVSTLETYFQNQSLPNFRKLVALCIALECSVDYLAGLSDQPRSHGPADTDIETREAYARVEADLRDYQSYLATINSLHVATLVAEVRGHLRTLSARLP